MSSYPPEELPTIKDRLELKITPLDPFDICSSFPGGSAAAQKPRSSRPSEVTLKYSPLIVVHFSMSKSASYGRRLEWVESPPPLASLPMESKA